MSFARFSDRADRGSMLLEILMAMAILAFVLIGLLQVVITAHESAAMSRARSIAIRDAQAIVDQMLTLRNQGTPVPGGIVAAYPPGTFATPPTSLPGESIAISYEDPAAVPLFVTVLVQWNDLRGRTLRESLSTAINNN